MKTIFTLILIAGLFVSNLHADTDIEQQRLGQLVKELELVRHYAERLQSQSGTVPNQRIRFRYDVVIKHLSALEKGVREHIDLQHAQPKQHWFLNESLPGNEIE